LWFPVIQKNDSIGMSKHSYMEAVVEGLRAVSAVDIDFIPYKFKTQDSLNSIAMNDACDGTKKKRMYVRLLLSIDRRETTEAAIETVRMFMSF